MLVGLQDPSPVLEKDGLPKGSGIVIWILVRDLDREGGLDMESMEDGKRRLTSCGHRSPLVILAFLWRRSDDCVASIGEAPFAVLNPELNNCVPDSLEAVLVEQSLAA